MKIVIAVIPMDGLLEDKGKVKVYVNDGDTPMYFYSPSYKILFAIVVPDFQEQDLSTYKEMAEEIAIMKEIPS